MRGKIVIAETNNVRYEFIAALGMDAGCRIGFESFADGAASNKCCVKKP